MSRVLLFVVHGQLAKLTEDDCVELVLHRGIF